MNKYRKGYLRKQIASLAKFKSQDVYYVDDIPCIFLAIVNNIAKVKVIKDDFSTEVAYIAKVNDCFAHGKTKEQALKDANSKYFSKLDIDSKIAEFISKFKTEKEYPVMEFYIWHNILTGSCKYGRDLFVRSHKIDIENGKMDVKKFISITENEYNGHIIKQIKNKLENEKVHY